jgi:transposase
MDNLSIHAKEEVRQIIEEAGHLVRYLPPYSPDYNPIELTFSVLKAGYFYVNPAIPLVISWSSLYEKVDVIALRDNNSAMLETVYTSKRKSL